MKSQRLQAQFIRKREIEQQRFSQTNGKHKMLIKSIFDEKITNNVSFPSAVQKYYDQWGRITSRHEHWSTPEYYHEAEEKLKKQLALEEKQKKLTERQERLKSLLTKEIVQLDNELKGRLLNVISHSLTVIF